MDTDGAFDIVPWLKTDLISGFSDLLDDRISDSELQASAATLNSTDLGVALPAAPCVDYSTDQVSPGCGDCRTSPTRLPPLRRQPHCNSVRQMAVPLPTALLESPGSR